MSKSHEFTQKLRLCKGCHNEIHPDVPRCLVCGTPNQDTGGQPVVPAPQPTQRSQPKK